MAKKLQLVFNSPVILISSFVSILIFILQCTAFPNLISDFFSSNTAQETVQAFSVTNPLHYIRLFTLIFGHSSMQALTLNIVILLLLGPRVEERYGSVLLILMFAISSFVSGIISAMFLPLPIFGLDGIALLLVILTLYECANLKEISFSYIVLLMLLLSNSIVISVQQNYYGTLVLYLGSLCAGTFGFLDYSERKKKKPRKKNKTQNQQ